MICWHFSTGKLGYGDNREIIIGETHTVDISERPLSLCVWGLHASQRIIDALDYAPGPWVYRVELGGEILLSDDKACAERRTYLDGLDATEILREFSRWCALEVIHQWDAPEVVRRYLTTGDESLREGACAAARAATDAAWAAWDAALNAALDDVLDVALDAAREKQNTRLTEMVEAALRD